MIQRINSKMTWLRESAQYGKINRKEASKKRRGLAKWIDLIRQFINSCMETDIFAVSAQSAFIILLALLPTLLFIVSICSRIIPDFENIFFNIVKLFLPTMSYNYVHDEILLLMGYLRRSNIALFILMIVCGTISSHTILISLNQTLGYPRYQSRRWEWAKAFLLLIFMSIIITIFAGLGLFLSRHIQIVFDVIDKKYYQQFSNSFNPIFYIIMFLLFLFLGLDGIYTIVPEKFLHFRDTWPGALISTAMITVGFFIYVYFLNKSSNYLVLYGTYSGLFLMLTALYILCFIVNIGAKFSVLMAKEN